MGEERGADLADTHPSREKQLFTSQHQARYQQRKRDHQKSHRLRRVPSEEEAADRVHGSRIPRAALPAHGFYGVIGNRRRSPYL